MSRPDEGKSTNVGGTVFKFGGTSLGDAARIRHVARLIADQNEPPVVVVSALAGVTDTLVELAAALTAVGGEGAPPGRDTSGGAGADAREYSVAGRGADARDDAPANDDSPASVEATLKALTLRHLEVLEALVSTEDASSTAREIEERMGTLGRADWTSLPRAAATDAIAAAGERLAASIVAAAIRAEGRPAEAVPAEQVVVTDASFGAARPLDGPTRAAAHARLRPLLEAGTVPVVPGFVGGTQDGRTTTLGRGGSDLSAVVLAAALGSDRVHIFTDVDGILSGDPKTVDDARILDRIGYEEAVELSYFGATVIHPGAAKYAVSQSIPVQIRNTFHPDRPGTLILPERWGPPEVAAVAFKPDVVLIKVRSHPSGLAYGFLARVFEILARHRLPVDLVATSHSSTAFTIAESEEIQAVSAELSEFAEVEVVRRLATVTVVGRGLLEEPGIDALVFREVGSTPIYIISQASDVSSSFLVALSDAPEVVRRIHAALIQRHRLTEMRRSGT